MTPAHYKGTEIIDLLDKYGHGKSFCIGNIVKYTLRYNDKGGVADLEKAKHYLEILIKLETK